MTSRPSRTAAAAAVTLLLAACGTAVDAGSTATPAPSTVVSGERTYTDLSRDHVEGEVAYPQSPPVGGEHSQVWVPCDGQVYAEPVPDVSAVHSLEHGAVWVTWQPSLAAAEVEALHAKVEGVDYRFGSPYPGLASPITLTAWGHQMDATSPDDPRIDEFLTAYTNGPQTPEPGATCEGPADGESMSPDVHSS